LCLRVRERKDVDLILGQGMLTAGWHANTLNAPGKFLLSAPGFDTPRRARAYLITDTDAAATAARHAPHRPDLDPGSAAALIHPAAPTDPAPADQTSEPVADPEAAFWAALHAAPEAGLSIGDLMRATGKRRTWIYERLTHHTHTGHVTQVSRGRWRATTDHEPYPPIVRADVRSLARACARRATSRTTDVRADNHPPSPPTRKEANPDDHPTHPEGDRPDRTSTARLHHRRSRRRAPHQPHQALRTPHHRRDRIRPHRTLPQDPRRRASRLPRRASRDPTPRTARTAPTS